MKKVLIIFSLFLAAFAARVTAQSSIIITNNTLCGVDITLFAEDACGSGCGGWISNTISVASTSGTAFNTQVQVNLSTCTGYGPGWTGGCFSASCLVTGHGSNYGWDGAAVSEPGYFSATTGAAGGCILISTFPISDCSNNAMYADWTPASGGADTYLTIHY